MAGVLRRICSDGWTPACDLDAKFLIASRGSGRAVDAGGRREHAAAGQRHDAARRLGDAASAGAVRRGAAGHRRRDRRLHRCLDLRCRLLLLALRLRAQEQHAPYLAPCLVLQRSYQCRDSRRSCWAVIASLRQRRLEAALRPDLHLLPRACAVSTLGMTMGRAHPARTCAGLGSDLAVDDMSLRAKLALPLPAMPGSRGNLPMTPRSAMLTPRRLGLSGTAKVSCCSILRWDGACLPCPPSQVVRHTQASLPCVSDMLSRYRAIACASALWTHCSFLCMHLYCLN